MAERRTAGKKSSTSQKEFMKINFDDLNISRAFAFDNGNVSFDMEYKGMKLYRLTVVETKKGDTFISFPSYESNGKWYSYYYMPISDKDQETIIDMVYDVVNED